MPSFVVHFPQGECRGLADGKFMDAVCLGENSQVKFLKEKDGMDVYRKILRNDEFPDCWR